MYLPTPFLYIILPPTTTSPPQKWSVPHSCYVVL
jgi:hypothetical protein